MKSTYATLIDFSSHEHLNLSAASSASLQGNVWSSVFMADNITSSSSSYRLHVCYKVFLSMQCYTIHPKEEGKKKTLLDLEINWLLFKCESKVA
jgi:hypothetical protein